MKVLCAVGMQRGSEIIHRLEGILDPQNDLYLLLVLDMEPRNPAPPPLGQGPLYPPQPPLGRERPINEAEQVAVRSSLDEASFEAGRAGFHYQTDVQRGNPEQMIVQMAQARGCQLIVILANEEAQWRPSIGPESVGHTAPFVLDHASCDVLLLRTSLT